ncbi:MAG TPA: hypothetical protein VJ647_06505 [Chitinophagaceae bacterium]|nr:hypothetical protein [Chitinophagaceae bacterium]
MNRLHSVLLFFAIALLTACSPKETKKVVIMASGKVTAKNNNIKVEPGTQHNEQTVSFSGDDRVVLSVETPEGTDTMALEDNGLYVLNLRMQDTLVGGIVKYGESSSRTRVSDEELNHLIDSTRRLILGMGANDEDKTYFILPNMVKKISTDLNAIVVGPFQGIPYELDRKDGKVPEVYKLYTNKQQRESLLDLFKRMK